MTLSLSDALSHYRACADATHRFWGYFQAVAVGTAAFAWSRTDPEVPLFGFLTISFIAFSVANLRLIRSSQREAVVADACIKNYAKAVGSTLPPDLSPMINGIKPDSVRLVSFWHVMLSMATIGAVWWRFCTLHGSDAALVTTLRYCGVEL